MIHFYNPAALWALPLVLLVAGLFVHAAIQRRKALKRFGAHQQAISRKREALGSCAAITLLILALARPAWNVQEQALQKSGRDVIFLLDVSRSMLAEDLHPNRLKNAKTAIRDCLETLSGDRVGLLLFAGSAEIRCPLTMDYDYFRMVLDRASPDSISVGSTVLANALTKAAEKLLSADRAGFQDLLLITDGEDLLKGPDELTAAKLVAETGARLIAIGLGDRIQGQRIKETDPETGLTTFAKVDHQEIWTKLHPEILHQLVATIPDSIYFEVANGPFDLRKIYTQVMLNAKREASTDQVVESYQEHFSLFLAAAFIALLLTQRRARP